MVVGWDQPGIPNWLRFRICCACKRNSVTYFSLSSAWISSDSEPAYFIMYKVRLSFATFTLKFIYQCLVWELTTVKVETINFFTTALNKLLYFVLHPRICKKKIAVLHLSTRHFCLSGLKVFEAWVYSFFPLALSDKSFIISPGQNYFLHTQKKLVLCTLPVIFVPLYF